uniref:Uncharacterized protein n=1 Tax=viral metagenome TaxID=1070528 RepID=A0A6C0D015_9ZZZZ
MSITYLQHAGAALSIAGIIFKIGQQSEKLEMLGVKVEAQENRDIKENEHISDIKNDMILLKTDVSYIKQDIHDIKNKIK